MEIFGLIGWVLAVVFAALWIKTLIEWDNTLDAWEHSMDEIEKAFAKLKRNL